MRFFAVSAKPDPVGRRCGQRVMNQGTRRRPKTGHAWPDWSCLGRCSATRHRDVPNLAGTRLPLVPATLLGFSLRSVAPADGVREANRPWALCHSTSPLAIGLAAPRSFSSGDRLGASASPRPGFGCGVRREQRGSHAGTSRFPGRLEDQARPGPLMPVNGTNGSLNSAEAPGVEPESDQPVGDGSNCSIAREDLRIQSGRFLIILAPPHPRVSGRSRRLAAASGFSTPPAIRA